MKPPKVSITRALGIIWEDHSRLHVLAWLLNPREWHGWGRHFLPTFVSDILLGELATPSTLGFKNDAGWSKARVQVLPSSIVVRHPKGFVVAFTFGVPGSPKLRRALDMTAAKASKSGVVQLYMAPWDRIPTSKKERPDPPHLCVASCGNLYLSRVLKSGLSSLMKGNRKTAIQPAALALLEDFARDLNEQVKSEDHDDHR